MKQLRFFFCVFILLILFVVQTYAEDNIYNNPIEAQTAGEASVVKESTTDYFGWNLFANAGFAYDGVTVGNLRTLSSTSMGFFYSGNLNYRPQYSAYSFELRYQGINTPYSRMTGFTPTSFNVTHTDLMFLAKFRPKSESTSGWRNFYIGLGYYQHTRLIDQTLTPKTVIDQVTGGPVLAVGNTAPLSSKFNYQADLYIKLPNTISEPRQATTGQLQAAYGGELSFTVIYPYTDLLDIGLGVWYQMNQLVFRSSGSRGVTSATETETMYGVPLEFRFKF